MVIIEQAGVKRPQNVRVRPGLVRVLLRKYERLFIVETFLDQSSLVLVLQEITGHLISSIITTCHVVMR